MPFDFDAYLANKAAADSKLQSVIDASTQKVEGLRAFDDAKKSIPGTAQPWSDQLGLEPGSFVANRVNDAASLVSGASRLAGQVASLPVSLSGLDQTLPATQADVDAYNRHTAGHATADDLALLERKPQADGPTMMERFRSADKTRVEARGINNTADLTSIVDQHNRQGLSADLTQGFKPEWDKITSGEPGKVVSGLAGLLVNTGSALVKNPSAVREYILENAPQLFAGAFGKAGQLAMGASNIGYAVDEFQQGMENYAKANGGALPPVDQQHKMALQAASLAMAEEAGDLVGLHGAHALGMGEKEIARTSFLQSMKNVGKGAAEGVLGEAPTEGYQQYMEGQVEGKPQTPDQIYQAAVIGGASGAGLSGGGRTVAELAQATPAHAAEREQLQQKVDDHAAAIQSGDVSSLIDPKSKDYSPAQAIAALHGNSQLETTDDATKQANLQKADEILAALEKERSVAAANQLDPAKRQANIDNLKQQLAGETDPEFKQMLQEEITAQVADAAKPVDKTQAKQRQDRLAKLDTELAQARQNRDALGTLVTPQDQVDSAVQTLQDPAKSQEHGAAADKMITLAMTAPDRVDPKVASQLADDTQNGLTDTQRGFLRSFSDARVAANQLMNMGKVSQAIYLGDKNKGDVGIAQYRSNIATALAAGDRKAAYMQLSALQRFADAHTAKSQAAQQAMKQGFGSQIQRTKSGDWITAMPAQNLSPSELQKNGGLAIKSRELVSNIGTEADAITKATQEMRQAYALKFTKPTQTTVAKAGAQPQAAAAQSTTKTDTTNDGAKDVQNPAREKATGTAAEPQAQAAKNPDAVGTGSATTGKGAVSDAGKRADDVQAAGVKPPAPRVSTSDQGTSGSSVSSTEVTSAKKDSISTETSTGTSSKSSVENQSTEKHTAEPVPKVESELTKADQSSTSVTDNTDKTAGESTTAALPAAPAGQLGALTDKSPEGTMFQSKTLGDFLSQAPGKEDDKTQRPLVAVKDFLSSITGDLVLKYTGLEQLSEKQKVVLQLFKSTALDWFDNIRANLFLSQSDNAALYRYNDLMQFLVQGSGKNLDLEENLKTAMAHAAFGWIADNAARPLINDDEEINTILGREESHLVTEAEREILAHVGTRQNLVVNTLGQRVVQALGIKAEKDTPRDILPKLQAGLGAHVMKLLVDQGIVERNTVEGEVMASLTGDTDTNTAASNFFLHLSDQNSKAIEQIRDSSIGTQGLLDKLFGVEQAMKDPELKPIESAQKTTKNTNQKIPSKLAKIVAFENKTPFFVRQDMWTLMGQLSDDTLQEIAGAEAMKGKHAANKKNVEAMNDGLLREIKNFRQFVGGMEDREAGLYFEHTVWKQQRVGIATNVVNPQTSKVHRHMLARESWKTEVDTTNTEQMANFKLRVLEGLGVKTDKQTNAVSLAGFNSLFDAKQAKSEKDAAKAKTLNAGVRVLIEMLEGKDMSEAKQGTLVAAVLAGGENMHSLDALMAVAHWKLAEQNKQTKFTTQLMGEVDGVTNGPMLTHLLLGAANSVKDLFGLLNRGGFFEQGSAQNQYNLWKAASVGHTDLYETVAKHITEGVQSLIDGGVFSSKGKKIFSAGEVRSAMAPIYLFTGELVKDDKVTKDGRNIVKTPLTAMVFGSSVAKAVDSMANNFVESIYTKIEDAKSGRSSLEAAEIVDAINTLLDLGRAPRISRNLSIEQLMKTQLSPSQVEGLKKVFKFTVGNAVKGTMAQEFAEFITRRKQLNDAAQLAFTLYDSVHTATRDELIAELVKSGEIATNKKGDPIHDLNAKQEAELQKRLAKVQPMMHTLMSKESGEHGELSAGLLVAKSDRRISQRSIYGNEVKFGSKFGDNNAGSTRVKALETSPTSPGVAMTPMSVHSTDSAISHSALDGHQVLNIHDAHGSGIAGFTETAQRLNQATWDAMLAYSPAHEMSETLSRTVLALADLAQSGELPPAAVTAMAEAISKLAADQKMDSQTYLRSLFQSTRSMAAQADQTKLQALAQMQSIDQYALEGGNYQVTDQDRAKAAALAEKTSQELTAEEKAALDTIEKALAKEVGATEADSREVTKRESNELVADNEQDTGIVPTTKTSPFGELGASRGNDPAITEFFTKNPTTTAKAVMEFLYGQLKGQAATPQRDFYAKLLSKLRQVLPADLKVQMVTSETQRADVLNTPDKPARGWFVTSSAGDAIYVAGPDFAHSTLKPEVLLHELVHAAVTLRLRTPEAKAQLAELEQLLEQAKAFVKERNLSGFDAALSNVDELIAYGMTNQKFQQVVLAQLQVKSKTLGTLTSAMKAFVTTLSRLLGFKDTASANGLGVLIANVTGIINQQDTAQPDVVLSMAAAANSYSTLDILNGLQDGSVGPAFQDHLREILGGIVQTLHGPFGSFKADLMENQAGTPMDVWNKALATGKAPFASKIAAAGFKISSQEMYAIEQVEATMLSALNASEARTKMAYRELAELYNEVYRNTKPADFRTGDPVQDQALYDFVFKIEKNSGSRSDYLARFAALGLAHQGFNQILQQATDRQQRPKAQSLGERLQQIFENILEFFRDKMTRTYTGQNADAKLRTLVEQLVDIEAKNQAQINARLDFDVEAGALLDRVRTTLDVKAKAAKAAVEKLAGSDFVRNHKNSLVRATGSVVRTTINGQVEDVMEHIATMRDEHMKNRHGIAAGFLNDLRGPTDQMKTLLSQAKHNEGTRQDIMTSVAKTTRETFGQLGEALTPKEDAAVTQAFLRTGAHVLLDHFDLKQIHGLLSDPKTLQAAIDKFSGQLPAKARNYYWNQAKVLGFYKATGRVSDQLMMTNAENIAQMYGTGYHVQSESDQAHVTPGVSAIRALVALHAIEYLSNETRETAASVLDQQSQRSDHGNGIQFALSLHKQLEDESRSRLFQDSEALMMHGYTPEIVSPFVTVQVTNVEEGKDLMNLGYVQGAALPLDPHDPDQQVKHIYVLRGAGPSARLTGSMSYTGTAAKGSPQHSGYVNPMTTAGMNNLQANSDILNQRQAAIQKLFTRDASKFDPRQVGRTFMAPIVNPAGQIVNWRYLMQEQTKDTLLERDNSFDKVLGVMAGSIFDKSTAPEQNRIVVQALKDQFDAEFSIKANQYTRISATSPDEQAREAWAILPKKTKDDVLKIWGDKGMFVRHDALDIVFGYKKISAADMFTRSLSERDLRRGMGLPDGILSTTSVNALQKLLIAGVESVLMLHARTQKGMDSQQAEAYARRAAVIVTRGERMWQEIVKETKDLIVNKTGVVLLRNIRDNFSQLVLAGVPIKDIVHHHIVALRAAVAHQTDNEELQRLKLMLSTGYSQGNEKEMERRVVQLEDSLARNPITPLVDKGMMPTIVQDVERSVNDYSYKSQLGKKIEAVTAQLPPSMLKLAKTVYMAHDTPLYKGLERITQLSDFVARYTMYQYLVNRKEEPLTQDAALTRVIDEFVQYDVPMHQMIQYMDDTGLIMFSKYTIRMQRVLSRILREHPGTVLSTAVLSHYLGNMSTVLDSYWPHKIGQNPLQPGAFKFFSGLGELATIKAPMKLLGM